MFITRARKSSSVGTRELAAVRARAGAGPAGPAGHHEAAAIPRESVRATVLGDQMQMSARPAPGQAGPARARAKFFSRMHLTTMAVVPARLRDCSACLCCSFGRGTLSFRLRSRLSFRLTYPIHFVRAHKHTRAVLPPFFPVRLYAEVCRPSGRTCSEMG